MGSTSAGATPSPDVAPGTDSGPTSEPGRAPSVLTEPTVILVPPLTVVTVLVMSTPGWVPLATWLTVGAWVALAVVWVVAVVSYLRTRRRVRTRSHPMVALLVFPGFLAIVLVLAAAAIPLRARFALSRDELAATADAVLVGSGAPPDTSIGSFPMQSVETDGHAVWFVTEGLGSDDRWGFVYDPEGSTDRSSTDVLDLEGGWYAFHEGSARFPFL